MVKKLDKPSKKYTMRLTEGAPERLKFFFPRGYNEPIRALVDAFLANLEEQYNRELSSKEQLNVTERATAIISNARLGGEPAGEDRPEEPRPTV